MEIFNGEELIEYADDTDTTLPPRVKYDKYINLRDYANPDYFITVILKGRVSGASFCLGSMAGDDVINGRQFAWFRDTEREIKNSHPDSFINQVWGTINHPANQQAECFGTGCYGKKKVLFNGQEKEIIDYSKTFGRIFSFDKPYKNKSGDLTNCQNMYCDEIINPDYKDSNFENKFQSIYETLYRQKKLYVWMVGNKEDGTELSEILNALDIVFDWDDPRPQHWYDKSRHIQAHFLPNFTAEEMRERRNLVREVFSHNTEYADGGMMARNIQPVLNWNRFSIADTWVPKWVLSFNSKTYTIGEFDYQGQKLSYVKFGDMDKERKLRHFSLDAISASMWNTLLPDVVAKNIIRKLYFDFAKGKVFFSTFESIEELQKMFKKIEGLLMLK